MSAEGYQLPGTLRRIVRENRDHGIYLLEGNNLISFPA
jgi:hypothetical protein